LRHDVGRLIVESIIGLKWKGLKNHCSCDLAAKQAKRLGGHKGKKKLFSRLSKVVRHLHGCSQKAKRTIVQKKYKKVIDILDKMGKKAKNKLKSKAKKSLRKSKNMIKKFKRSPKSLSKTLKKAVKSAYKSRRKALKLSKKWKQKLKKEKDQKKN